MTGEPDRKCTGCGQCRKCLICGYWLQTRRAPRKPTVHEIECYLKQSDKVPEVHRDYFDQLLRAEARFRKRHTKTTDLRPRED